MKRKICVFFSILMICVVFVGCSTETSSVGDISQTPTSNNDNGDIAKPSDEEKIDLSEWGIPEMYSTNNDNWDIDDFTIRAPKYLASMYYTSKIAEQQDGTASLISGQGLDLPAVENVENIWSTYIPYTIKAFESMYGVAYSDFAINVDESSPVTVGDYEMYMHKGTITYMHKKQSYSYQFVAYATKLKGSGNCAYWMVYDTSKEQSNGKLIAEYALYMAQTLQEYK